MAAHTDNETVIAAPVELAWRIANDIENWPSLFADEYQAVQILQRDGNRIVFRLQTFPGEDNQTHSWVSERVLDPERRKVTARRVETGPFLYMHIFQSFQEDEGGTRLRWVQDFEVLPTAPFTDQQMADRINRNSQVQLDRHRQVIEQAADVRANEEERT